jgi:SAM-dependent methyltransferase
MSGGDVPSPIDFHDLAQAKAWETDTIARRPYRSAFFRAFAETLNTQFREPFSVLELGSGPGHLAQAILSNCSVEKYAALDFSDAMHALARERLHPFLAKVEFVTRDFRDADWPSRLGPFNAIVTMQAAHEVRHVRHLTLLLSRARSCLAEDGTLLFCDHYLKPETGNPALYIPRDAQSAALQAAGFSTVLRLLDEGGMALYSARA